jgi:drug/metabolite transporter (DMT)-like permease
MSSAALFIICSAIWGSTWLAIKYQLDSVAPELSVAYRFTLAAVAIFIWCAATKRSVRFSLRQHGWLAALGFTLMGLNYIAIYWSERFVTSGLVAVLFATIVFMNPIGARMAFGTPLAARTLIGGALGITGVALLFLPELDQASRGGAAGYGVALGLIATLFACIGNLIAVRNHKEGIAILPETAWGMAYGALTAALAAIVRGVPWTFDTSPAYLLSLAYLTMFGSVIAFGAYFALLKRAGVGPASFTSILTPVIAMALSTLFEGYRWTWVAGLGVVLAVLGNWVALRARRADTSR